MATVDLTDVDAIETRMNDLIRAISVTQDEYNKWHSHQLRHAGQCRDPECSANESYEKLMAAECRVMAHATAEYAELATAMASLREKRSWAAAVATAFRHH